MMTSRSLENIYKNFKCRLLARRARLRPPVQSTSATKKWSRKAVPTLRRLMRACLYDLCCGLHLPVPLTLPARNNAVVASFRLCNPRFRRLQKEIARFQKHKLDDFTQSMLEYATSQAQFYQKEEKLWGTVADQFQTSGSPKQSGSGGRGFREK